jgi:hypothetical protein
LLRLIASVEDCKGQFLSLETTKTDKPRKESKGITLRKETKMVVRTGVQFANLSSVKQGIENGERGEVQSLPWGQWSAFPYGISHNGKEYFRFTLGANTRPTCRYFVNEAEVERADYIKHLTDSEQKPKEPSEVITVSLDNIIRLA